MIRSDHQSIFGDTYRGVPNPQIPFQHPYPTRYHGPIFTTPRFGLPFAARPYALTPYSGTADVPSTGGRLLRGAISGAVIGLLVGSAYGAISKKATSEKVGKAAGVGVGISGAIALMVLGAALAAMSSPQPVKGA